ncbi:MAG: discoidin domain-containing protein, partial [Phycisphaerae bacterium]
ANCAKGIWAYGNAYDDVIADNTSINTSGIYQWAINGSYDANGAYDVPDYFTRMTRNTVTGVSPRNNCGGIGFNTGRWSGPNAPYLDVMIFGTEITNNSITGNNTLNPGPGGIESGPFSGIYAIAYYYSNRSNGIGTGDVTNTIIENNTLSNLKYGITLSTSDYGQVINRNTYDSAVLTFLLNSGTYGTATNTVNTNNAAPATNLALSKTASASSGANPGYVTDSSVTTEWTSTASDPQWIQIDLAANYTITSVALSWGDQTYAKSFQIQTSLDGTNWTTVYSTTSGAGGTHNISVLPTIGRYVRLTGTVRNNATLGYSLWDFKIYGY